MIEKIRPIAKVAHSDGNDGRDAYVYIEFRCPKCNRLIRHWKADNACDACGTFYEWGKRPELVKKWEIKWD